MTLKTASPTLYLIEELGDARLNCDHLTRYIDEAVKLVEKSPQRDRVFEVAGHLITAIPATLFKLQKSLQAVSLATARIDYEELKQELRPEKVEELERVLEDVRVRHVRRRSDPNAKVAVESGALQTVEDIRGSATVALRDAQGGRWKRTLLSMSNMSFSLGSLLIKLGNPDGASKAMALVREIRQTALRLPQGGPDETEEVRMASWEEWKSDEVRGAKEAAALSPEVQTHFMDAMLALRNAARGVQPKKQAVAAVAHLASALAKMGEDRAQAVLMRAHDVMKASGMWDLTKEGSDEEKKSKFEEGEPADPTENMSPEDAKKWKTEHAKNKDKFKSASDALRWKEGSDEEKKSKFEEGKPADPTDNMSDEDAKKWRLENLKNKDNFKEGSGRTKHLEGKKGFTACGERAYSDTLVDSVKDATCHYCKQAWERAQKQATTLATSYSYNRFASDQWSKKGDNWVARVQYAGAPKAVEWEIQSGGESSFKVYAYGVELGHDYVAKREFTSLAAAQRFAKPYLEANGLDKLKEGSDFKKV